MRLSRFIAAAVALCVLVGFEQPVRACGGMFGEAGEIVDMSDQRALLVYDEGRVDQYVQVAYEGNPASFAWVYPFPALPTTVEEDTRDLFVQLDELTRPRWEISVPSSGDDGNGGCGCGPLGAGDDDGMGDWDAGRGNGEPPVTVWDSGQVGIFDYTVITAESIDDMTGWLKDNGFVIPEKASAVLQHYVDLGWFFVAMKLSPDNAQASAVTATVKFSFLSDSRVYPLYMSSISAAARAGVLLYVLAPHRVKVGGPFETVAIPSAEVKAIDEHTTNYDALFTEATAGNNERTFVVEFASPGAPYSDRFMGLGDFQQTVNRLYLTRLRTTMPSTAMIADLTLEDDATDEAVESYYWLSYGELETNSAAINGPALFFGLLLFAAYRGFASRRRARRER